MAPLVVGLTGGIGSGKSTVTALFSAHHVPIIDADVIARRLTEKDQVPYQLIVQHFGQDMLLEDGSMNRKKLRRLVFQEAKERRWLEDMLHPFIRAEIKKQIQGLTSGYCIVVIPLLFETMQTSSSYDFLDRILVVDAPVSLQIERASARDKSDLGAIQAILDTQTTRAERLAKADDIITNDGRLEDLVPQVEGLHHLYRGEA